MNKKYKPKKPIEYDTDRSLLHSASETLLFAKGKDTIIGQPQCNTKQVQIGTKRVQVGTNTTKDIFGIWYQYIPFTNSATGGTYKVIVKPNTDNVKCVYRRLLNRANATEQQTTTSCPKGKATIIKQFTTSSNSGCKYDIWDIYSGDKVVYTLNGFKSKPSSSKPQQISYSEPIYEDQPVYKTEVDRGLIMYLRRKGA